MAITIVIANAVTASMLTCWEMLKRLRPVGNVSGSRIEKKIIKIINAARVA